MLATTAATFPVFALILIGWAAGRRGLFGAEAVVTLNAFVVRLALPVLLFQFVAEADWARLWHPAFVAALGGGIAIVFAAVLLFAPRGDGIAARSVAALAGGYANTAFMGIPIAHALLGEVGLAAAVIASLLTVGVSFACAVLLIEIDLHRDRGLAQAALGVLRSMLGNPLVTAPLAGVAWALLGWPLPAPLHQLAALLGGTAAPVALLTIGLFLATTPASASSGRVLPMVAIKLVGQPLATYTLARLLAVPAEWTMAAVLLAAMPTGTGPFMLARLYGLDAAVAARVILVTTILSAATIPLVVRLLG